MRISTPAARRALRALSFGPHVSVSSSRTPRWIVAQRARFRRRPDSTRMLGEDRRQGGMFARSVPNRTRHGTILRATVQVISISYFLT
jgi:hypothetical protein